MAPPPPADGPPTAGSGGAATASGEGGAAANRVDPKTASGPQKPAECDTPEACEKMGADLAVKGDAKGAEPFLVWACSKDVARACSNLGALHLRGEAEQGLKKDEALALELSKKACGLGHAGSCTRAAALLFQGKGVKTDKAGAYAMLEAGCKLGDAGACFNQGSMLSEGVGVKPDPAAAFDLFKKACEGGAANGCFNVGASYIEGTGVKQDDQAGKVYMDKACELGSKQACEVSKQLAAQSSARVPGANLNIESMSADGMTVRDLQCKVDGLGILGSVTLIAALGKRKRALDACAPKGAAPDVLWSFSGGRVTSVKVEGLASAAAGSCVERNMKAAKMPGAGTCGAELLIGNKQGAERAAAAKK